MRIVESMSPGLVQIFLQKPWFSMVFIRTHLATSPTRGPRSRSEVRGPRSEVRGPRFEVRGPRFEVRGPSQVRSPEQIQIIPLYIQKSKPGFLQRNIYRGDLQKPWFSILIMFLVGVWIWIIYCQILRDRIDGEKQDTEIIQMLLC